MPYSASKNYDYEAVRQEARDKLNDEAENLRLQYITNGTGQSLVYGQKYDEAVQQVEDRSLPSPVREFKLIAAEARATGKTEDEVADLVIATRNQWLDIAAAIEEARMGALAAIDNAADQKTAIQQAGVVDWPAVIASLTP